MVKVRRIRQAAFQPVEEFYATLKSTGHFQLDMREINRHFQVGGEASGHPYPVVFSDEIQGTFLDGLLLRWDSPDFRPFKQWPLVWQKVIASAETIGNTDRIRYLSSQRLGSFLASCPAPVVRKEALKARWKHLISWNFGQE